MKDLTYCVKVGELTEESANNIKKALKKVAKELDCLISEVSNGYDGVKFEAFDFVNEFGKDISYEDAYHYISWRAI